MTRGLEARGGEAALPEGYVFSFLVLAVAGCCVLAPARGIRGQAAGAPDPPDVFCEDLSRLEADLASPVDALRLSAARGLSSLGHKACEPLLLRLLADPWAQVRREAAFGLGRSGGRDAVQALAGRCEDRDAWVRDQAAASLARLTGLEPPRDRAASAAPWRATLAEVLVPDRPARRERLRERLEARETRRGALREAALFGGPEAEELLLDLHAHGTLARDDLPAFFAALGRVATASAIPVLAAGVPAFPDAAWALGDLGGEAAEGALLDGLRRGGVHDIHVLANLDRLHSRALYPFAPGLLQCFGLVSYRGLPDDLHLEPTPIQRVASRLLLRTGNAVEIADLLLRKLEGRPPDPAGLSGEGRALVALLDRMSEELKPGFHRADSAAEALPLAALPHIVTDRAIAPRLEALLGHPALVVRVYAATALCRLRAPGAAAAVSRVIRGPYPFDDAVTQVSGKHGPEVSGPVRWKGYLAMALGVEGSDGAREALEAILVHPCAPRDVRFGAAVGLRRIADPRSRPALERMRADEEVRWIAREADAALEAIVLGEKVKSAGGGVRKPGAPEPNG